MAKNKNQHLLLLKNTELVHFMARPIIKIQPELPINAGLKKERLADSRPMIHATQRLSSSGEQFQHTYDTKNKTKQKRKHPHLKTEKSDGDKLRCALS